MDYNEDVTEDEEWITLQNDNQEEIKDRTDEELKDEQSRKDVPIVRPQRSMRLWAEFCRSWSFLRLWRSSKMCRI